jgi:hypothetical protein
MATLDRWRGFLVTPRTLFFPRLELIGHDWAPPIVVGSGEIRMPSLDRFEFTLKGLPDDLGYALSEIERQRRNRYDGMERFRLRGVDCEKREWSFGWTALRHTWGDDEDWTFVGEAQGLFPRDESDTVSSKSCTELVFLMPIDHTTGLSMSQLVLTKQADGRPRREHVLEVLGSTIRFQYEPSSGALFVTATHSAGLPPTYTENWLGEPFRILLGQLFFPRLVARNLGDGTTHVGVRPCRGPIGGAAPYAALWTDDDAPWDKEDFWHRYSEILTVIARARNFEAHEITQLYEQIIQSVRGTRWIWAMTFASCIERLANMLKPPGRDRSDADADAVVGLVDHINAWRGDDRLKKNAINAVKRSLKTTTIVGLRQILSDGVINKAQLRAWESIRNSVMHGSLISPYSSEEEDRKLMKLAEMMHALTREILQRCSAFAASTPS